MFETVLDDLRKLLKHQSWQLDPEWIIRLQGSKEKTKYMLVHQIGCFLPEWQSYVGSWLEQRQAPSDSYVKKGEVNQEFVHWEIQVSANVKQMQVTSYMEIWNDPSHCDHFAPDSFP